MLTEHSQKQTAMELTAFLFIVVLPYAMSINSTVDCNPDKLPIITIGQFLQITCNLTISDISGPFENFTLQVGSSNEQVATCCNATKSKMTLSSQDAVEFDFCLEGQFVGRSEIFFQLHLQSNEIVQLDKTLSITVLRKDGRIQMIFTAVITSMIVLNTFVMGMQLDWTIIKAILRKPIAPAIGLGCQFFCMPLLSFTWGMALLTGMPSLQLGLFAVGCAPGGGASNFWCILLGGNVDLSVTMTFVSNIAALAMMPFWFYTLGAYITAGSAVTIPFTDILISLVTLIVPCATGILLKHFRPNVEPFAKRIIKPISLVLIAILISFGTYANLYVFTLMTWKTILCGMLLPWSGFVVGFLIAYVLRLGLKTSLTICIETGIQNTGVAIMIVSFSLPHPDSDLSLVMPICATIFTPLPLLAVLTVKSIYKRCRHRKSIKISPATEGQKPVKMSHKSDSTVTLTTAPVKY